jgi:spermidine/putrescine-binding protein
MPLDIPVLAATIVSSFMLPYVKKGIDGFVSEMSKKTGESAAAQVSGVTKTIWNKVKSAFSSEEDTAALSTFEKRPEVSTALIETILKEKLEQDASLAEELNSLLNTKVPGGSETVAEVINNSGVLGVVNVKQSNFSHSTGATLIGVSSRSLPKQSTNSDTES